MRVVRRAKKTAVDEKRRQIQDPAKLQRQELYRMYERLRHITNVNADLGATAVGQYLHTAGNHLTPYIHLGRTLDVAGPGPWKNMVFPGPPVGSSHLVSTVRIFNGDWAPRTSELTIEDGVKSCWLDRATGVATLSSRALPTLIGYPRPIVVPHGWDLWGDTDGRALAGGTIRHTSYYALESGLGPIGTRYGYQISETPPGHTDQWQLVASPPANTIRFVTFCSYPNEDSVAHDWFVYIKDTVTPLDLQWLAKIPIGIQTTYYSGPPGIVPLTPGMELWAQFSTAQVTTSSTVYACYMDAGGFSNCQCGGDPWCDCGPWDVNPVPIFNGKSIDFDGNTDKLRSSTSQALGIADDWTVAVWAKPQGNGSNTQWVWMHAQGSNPSRIHLYRDTQQGSYPWRIHCRDLSGNNKDYRFGENLTMDTWHLIVCTHALNDLKCYVDGQLVTPTPVADDTMIAMVDSTRYMSLGGIAIASDTDGFDGRVAFAGSWSSVLTADEIAYFWNNPQWDWRDDGGDYTSSADLEHYQIAGRYGPPDMGHDYGLGSNTLDLDTEESVDATNIVDDAPGI